MDLGYSRQQDLTSWSHVKNAALRIATTCWICIAGSCGPTGGVVQIGHAEKIYVFLEKKGSGLMQAGNLTVTTENGTMALLEMDVV